MGKEYDVGRSGRRPDPRFFFWGIRPYDDVFRRSTTGFGGYLETEITVVLDVHTGSQAGEKRRKPLKTLKKESRCLFLDEHSVSPHTDSAKGFIIDMCPVFSV